jgi:asparagine synthase (glutamine-hydrolysing)
MCGIAGIWYQDKSVSEAVLGKMINTITHRGPDGTGTFINENLGLAHARLSIIDLSTGRQPIHNEEGNVWVIFNGEIFNYIELREKLEKQGHQFYTQTDTEVIVHLYEQYGKEFVNLLNGQFAIALWDKRKKKLLLARDRVGIAPLYYRQEASAFLFASEVKAILEVSEEPTAMNPIALDQLMTFWAPVSPETVFQNVFEVSPGQVLEIQDGKISKYKYWDWTFPSDGEYRKGDFDTLKEELHEHLKEATRIRLRSDVPVGAYLSGGLDSSVLVSLIHYYGNVPLRTFSIGFQDEQLDESKYQKEIINHLQADHSSVTCHHEDIARSIEDVIWHTEAPILRSAPVPMKLLSSLVHEQGYKVVLTGEGSDEVLGGYDIFKEAKIRQFWAKNPDSEFRSSLLKRLYPYLDLSRGQAYLKNFFGEGLESPNLSYFSHLPRWSTTAKTKEFFSDHLKAQLNENAYDVMESSFPAAMQNWAPFNRSQYIESKTLMPGYLLSSQGDRMLLGNAVEGRFPFLDHRVIEFANSINPKYKMKALNEKYLLKESMRRYLPESIINRYKQPYRAPDIPSFYLSGKPVPLVEDCLSPASLAEVGYFDANKVSKLLKKIKAGRVIGYKDNMAFMAILTTQIWHRKFAGRG